jgi:hypothetical protein
MAISSRRGVGRFAQPLERELDIVRLQMAPAFDLGLVSILRVTLEVFRGECSGAYEARWKYPYEFGMR